MSTIQRLTTRGPKVAAAIANREAFKTSGALSGEVSRPGHHHGSGHLNSGERELFFADSNVTDYIVWSYATPIAWHRNDGRGWHKVNQKFSVTTSKHQGNLYLIGRTKCATCNGDADMADRCPHPV